MDARDRSTMRRYRGLGRGWRARPVSDRLHRHLLVYQGTSHRGGPGPSWLRAFLLARARVLKELYPSWTSASAMGLATQSGPSWWTSLSLPNSLIRFKGRAGARNLPSLKFAASLYTFDISRRSDRFRPMIRYALNAPMAMASRTAGSPPPRRFRDVARTRPCDLWTCGSPKVEKTLMAPGVAHHQRQKRCRGCQKMRMRPVRWPPVQ